MLFLLFFLLNNLFLNVHHSNSPRRRGSFLCCLLAARLFQTRGVNPNRKRHLVCGILSRCSQHFFEVLRYFSSNLRENHFVKHNASDSVPFVSAARFLKTGPVSKPRVQESGFKRKMNTFALPDIFPDVTCASWNSTCSCFWYSSPSLLHWVGNKRMDVIHTMCQVGGAVLTACICGNCRSF